MAKPPAPRRKVSETGRSRRAAPDAPREAAVEPPPAPPEPPRGPSSPTFFRPAPRRPPGGRQGGPVFGVGRQAFVDGQGKPKRQVGLVDEKALVSVGTLVDGTEVEIVGWVPKGPATRYLVRSTKDGVEGWLGAANLRATKRPTAPGAEPREPTPPVSIPPRMPRGEVGRRAAPPVPSPAPPKAAKRKALTSPEPPGAARKKTPPSPKAHDAAKKRPAAARPSTGKPVTKKK